MNNVLTVFKHLSLEWVDVSETVIPHWKYISAAYEFGNGEDRTCEKEAH